MPDPTASSPPTPAPAAAQRLLLSKKDFLTLTKARLSTLVVITTFVGFWLAAGFSDLWRMAHTVIGTTLTAFGAAVFNQLMEMDADAKMLRTADRPLPAKRTKPELAFAMGFLLCAFGIIHLGVKANVEAAALAALTLVVYLFIYTPMKQRSSLNTLVGAVSGALPPVIGWAAGRGGPDDDANPVFQWELLVMPQSLYLFALLFLWQMPHFLAINWMYREEYVRGGFVMWSNDDVSGRKTSLLAILWTVPLLALGIQPWAAGYCHWAFPIVSFALGAWILLLAVRFRTSLARPAARKLFFATLLYLPAILVALAILARRA
jgi:protoheme IX farnesyltransferase